MTEEEWLAITDPMPMVEFLKGKSSDRKMRLLGVAICRVTFDEPEEERICRAVETAEDFADGMADIARLEAVCWEAWDVRDEHYDSGLGRYDGAMGLAQAAGMTASVHEWNNTFNRPGPFRLYPWDYGPPSHCPLIRDIFGNPFRPVAFDPAWRTSTAVALAQQMYDSRDFGLMPILGDALQDAGCDSADILDHCRGDGPHVRGCWVADLVLGKS